MSFITQLRQKLKARIVTRNHHPQSTAKPVPSVLDAVWETYIVYKSMSFQCFTYPSTIDSTALIEMHWRDYVTLVAFLLLFGIQVWICCAHNVLASEENFILLDFGNIFVTCVGSSLTLCNNSIQFYRRYLSWKILTLMDEIDREFDSLGFSLDYKQHNRFLRITVVCTVLILSSAIIIHEWSAFHANGIGNTLFRVYVKVFSYGCLNLVLAVFELYLLGLRTRYHLLNECISCYFPLPTTSKVIQVVPLRPFDAISKCSVLYSKLFDTTNLINKCYGFLAMICFGIIFVFTVFTCFALYRTIQDFDVHELYSVIRSVYWNLIFLIQVLWIIVTAHEICSAGKQTGYAVHEILNMTKGLDDITEEIFKNFSLQIRHLKPVITCGFFAFDWTLIYGMAAAMGTYLMILIQFEET